MISKLTIRVLMLIAAVICGCNVLLAQSIKEQAEAGDMNAQYKYALSLSNNGDATSSNDTSEQLAFKWFLKAAQQGHSDAQNNVGFRYYYGKGVTKDYSNAFLWYQKSANQGNKVAIYNMGICYEYGNGVLKSLNKAFECYKLSADKGYSSAKRSLAKCYNRGIGTQKNYKEAFKLYSELADASDTQAEYELANMYLNGNGVEKDSVAAVDWLLDSACGGSSWTIHGSHHIPEDVNSQARTKLLEIANNVHSKYSYYFNAILGCMFEAESDFVNAEKYYKKSIEEGGYLGTIRLGLMYFYLIANSEGQPMDNDEYYETGLGLESYAFNEQKTIKARNYLSRNPVTTDECVKWIEKAIDYKQGCFRFGVMGYNLYDHLLFCYYDGIGTKKDVVKAIDAAYRSLCDKGNEPMSLSYYLSEAVLKASLENNAYSNEAYAKYDEIYKLVKDPRSVYSSDLLRISASGLGKAYYKGYGTSIDYNNAFKFLSIAADLDDTEAMRLLSACYRYGRGVQKSAVKEKEWLEKAVKKGDDRAVELANRLVSKI